MRATRSLVLGAVVAMVTISCGGDPETASTTTVSSTTTSSTTTTVAATTSTTAAPTTTTTTLPADTHPTFGVRWEEVWPPASATATYRVTTFDGDELDLPATMEYGVEFAGGAFDRLVVGTPEPGNDAMVIYFDRSEPWEIRVVGEEVFSAGRTDRADSIYVFEDPMVFDGLAPIGDTVRTEGRLALTLSTGDVLDLGVTYDVTVRGVEPVTVVAGDFEDALVVDALVGGELLGGDFTFPVEIWLDAEQLILRFVGATGFDRLELLEAWS